MLHPAVPTHSIPAARYHAMADAVPPAAWASNRFLLGEPVDHRACEITRDVHPTYRGFIAQRGENGAPDQFYELNNPVSLPEWQALAGA